MEDIYVYIYKNIYILNGIVGNITVSRDNLMERIVYRRGASPEKVWWRDGVKDSGNDDSSEIDGEDW